LNEVLANIFVDLLSTQFELEESNSSDSFET
jgi:hypothetical protein